MHSTASGQRRRTASGNETSSRNGTAVAAEPWTRVIASVPVSSSTSPPTANPAAITPSSTFCRAISAQRYGPRVARRVHLEVDPRTTRRWTTRARRGLSVAASHEPRRHAMKPQHLIPAVAVLAAAPVAVAVASTGGAHTSAARSVHVTLAQTAMHISDVAPAGDSPGDIGLISGNLLAPGAKRTIGHYQGYCV